MKKTKNNIENEKLKKNGANIILEEANNEE